MRDGDVRRALERQLSSIHTGDESLIVHEMGLWSGSARIDVAVVNGELLGFEIKSDRDTLGRLPFQAEVFSRVFDRVSLVVGRKHIRAARAIVPRWWGIVEAVATNGDVCLREKRGAKRNPSPDAFMLAQLLWRDEAIEALTCCGLDKGWRGKRVKKIHQRLASEVPFPELSSLVREALRARSGWLRQNAPDQFDMSIDA